MAHFFPVLPEEGGSEAERSLAQAFASFTEAAGSLERSYAELQIEVTRLRQELEITNRDLTRSLEENRRTHQQLHQILESLPCGVIVVNGENAICVVNQEAKKLLRLAEGLTRFDQLPRSLAEPLHSARREHKDQEWNNGLAESSHWLAIRHAPLADIEGVQRDVYILRDISDQKKLEVERERLQQQQALVEVSTLLAHEIRNPLGSLELFAELLADADLNEECRGWLGYVQAGLRTMAATVNNVLHVHERPSETSAETELGELLRWAYGFLLPVTQQARVQLEVLHRLDGVYVAADRHRLEQVVLNLALNGVRSMPGGGWLSLRGHIRRTPEGQFVEIGVIDTGPGIEATNIAKIFEPGFSTRPGSSGLGLSVARRIVEQYGGTLTVESKSGEGARFYVRFPWQGGMA